MTGKLILSMWLMLTLMPVYAQEQLGIRTSNYAGINATILNPSGHLTSPFSYDVNVLELSQHVSNNYLYLQNTGLVDLLRRGSSLSFYSAVEPPNGGVGPDAVFFDFYDDGRTRYAFSTTGVLGPSFYTALDEHHVVGLITRLRGLGSATSIPDNLSFYRWRDRAFNEPFEADPFRSASLLAVEVGLNYLYRQRRSFGWIGWGATLKYLLPAEGAYLDSPDHLQLMKPDSTRLTSEPFTMDLAFTNTLLQPSSYRPSINGRGLGLDVGFTLTLDRRGGGYRWKLGAALLDIGWVSFNRNAVVHEVASADTKTVTSRVYAGLDRPEEVEPSLQRLSEQLYGDPEASLRGRSFRMALPTALSLQADRHLQQAFYLSFILVQPLPLGATAPRRSALLAVSPRIEKPSWGIAMPVLLQHWRDARLGFSLRVGPVFLGSDDLGAFFTAERLNSADVYLALKVNPGLSRERRNGPSKRRAKVECYSF